MKRICAFLIHTACALAATCVSAQDAAIEAQEGDIEHWIEYYKKERGRSNEPVTEESEVPQTDIPETNETEAGRAPAKTPLPKAAD